MMALNIVSQFGAHILKKYGKQEVMPGLILESAR
jgi:hypothetical protein